VAAHSSALGLSYAPYASRGDIHLSEISKEATSTSNCYFTPTPPGDLDSVSVLYFCRPSPGRCKLKMVPSALGTATFQLVRDDPRSARSDTPQFTPLLRKILHTPYKYVYCLCPIFNICRSLTSNPSSTSAHQLTSTGTSIWPRPWTIPKITPGSEWTKPFFSLSLL
jgi:hypothetical protein